MAMLGQWYTSMQESRAARKAWNKGCPSVSLETAQHASQHHAQYWARWASELVVASEAQFTPASMGLVALVHTPFWVEVMRAHGKPEKALYYWYRMLVDACRAGNTSVLEAFAQVFDAKSVLDLARDLPFVHPRVEGWRFQHGCPSKRDIAAEISRAWDNRNFHIDAMTGSQGAAVFLDWIGAWLSLPDDLVSPKGAARLLGRIGEALAETKAEPGERGEEGLPTLRKGHQYRKYQPWRENSHTGTPLIAGDALRVAHLIYRRFGLEAAVMDALTGRWSQGDLRDPRICAIVYYLYRDGPVLTSTITDEQWSGIVQKAEEQGLMVQALEWADKKDVFSVYQAALPFFREHLARQELAQSLALGDVFHDLVF